MAAQLQSSWVEHQRRSSAPGVVARFARLSLLPSVQWPRVGPQQFRQSGTPLKPLQPENVVIPCQKTSWLIPFQDPAARMEVARQKVSRLQALIAMSDTERPEVDALRSALQRAREQSKGVPVDLQVKEGGQFLIGARAHFAEINKVRATIESNIAVTEARLERLKAEVVTEPVQEPVFPWAAEVQRLREELARVRATRSPVPMPVSPHPEFRRGRELLGGEGRQTSCWSCGAHSHQSTRCGRVVCQRNM